jgi:hypothetical protein
MSRAFDLANTFLEYSKDIQIFINTHSPAFYSLRNKDTKNTNVYLMKSDEGVSNLIELKNDASSVLDEQMGIIHYITPYVEEKNEEIAKLQLSIQELEKIKDNTKCIVLTEDEDTKYCELIFEMQGFDKKTTEFISYNGRTNLLAAMQSCEIKLSNKPHLTNIIFHRDSDIYNNDEEDRTRVSKKLEKLNKKGKVKYALFLTENYDLEAYLLNVEHILALSNKYSREEVQNFLDEATKETEEKSIDKLHDGIFKIEHKEYLITGKSIEFSASKTHKKVKELYNSNPIRYRYGKTVLGVLKNKLHKGSGKIDIEQKSDKIRIPELITIAESIK